MQHAVGELARLHQHERGDAVGEPVRARIDCHHVGLLAQLLDHHRRALLLHRVARVHAAFQRNGAQETELGLRGPAHRGDGAQQLVLQQRLVLRREVGDGLLAVGGSAHHQAERQRAAASIDGERRQAGGARLVLGLAERLGVDEAHLDVTVRAAADLLQVLAHALRVGADQRLVLGAFLRPEEVDAHRLVERAERAVHALAGAVQPVLREVDARAAGQHVDHGVERHHAHQHGGDGQQGVASGLGACSHGFTPPSSTRPRRRSGTGTPRSRMRNRARRARPGRRASCSRNGSSRSWRRWPPRPRAAASR